MSKELTIIARARYKKIVFVVVDKFEFKQNNRVTQTQFLNVYKSRYNLVIFNLTNIFQSIILAISKFLVMKTIIYIYYYNCVIILSLNCIKKYIFLLFLFLTLIFYILLVQNV